MQNGIPNRQQQYRKNVCCALSIDTETTITSTPLQNRSTNKNYISSNKNEQCIVENKCIITSPKHQYLAHSLLFSDFALREYELVMPPACSIFNLDFVKDYYYCPGFLIRAVSPRNLLHSAEYTCRLTLNKNRHFWPEFTCSMYVCNANVKQEQDQTIKHC